MIYKTILLYFILMAQVLWAKTATVKAYGMQFSVPPTRTSDGSILYFTSYDGSTSYPLQDSTTNFISNEFRQQSTGSPVFRADYLAGDAYNTYEYGSISYTISNTDSDGNGVPDWLQKENSVNLIISGNSTLHWQIFGGDSQNFSVSGSFTRSAGESEGNYLVYYSAGGYTASVSGNWYIGYFEGTINYDDGSFTMNVQSKDSDGISYNVSGSSSYSSASEDSLTLASIQLSGAVGNITSQASTFQRNGSVYSGSLKLVDGEPGTHWVDYENWYLEIEDSNDEDRDGIPDMSDASTSQGSSGSPLDESGWCYHVWPWVYSNSVGGWLYYANTSNGVMLWSNKHKSWYSWSSNNGIWQKN